MVFIVDDDEDVRESLLDVLAAEGYAVESAGDGDQALTRLRAMPTLPRLILLDWMMPRCDGEGFRQKQLADPRLANIPVVLLTADVHPTWPSGPLKVAGLLCKPVDLDELLETIERFIS